MAIPQARLEQVEAAFHAGAKSYGALGAPLYSALCARAAEDPDIVELAAHGMAGAQPAFHFLTTVHFLVLGDPQDRLADYFETIVDKPRPAEEAWPAFLRFCRERRDEIARTLSGSTVQTTFVDRCATMLPPIAWVADQIGEPLNLIEIGCSAGLLLTLDRHRYQYKDREPFGPADAPLTLAAHILGDPPLRIPRIGTRVGLDLFPQDVRDERARRWLFAQIFPEFRRQREQFAAAIEVVADTDIRMVAGDALDTLPAVLSRTADPVCIFHSICLSYWTDEAREALDALLIAASAGRTLFRVGSEPSPEFSAWNKGHNRTPGQRPPPSGEVVIARYRDGRMDSRVVAFSGGTGAGLEWRGWGET